MANTAHAAKALIDGATLRRLREDRGMTQDELASKAEIASSTLQNLENGRSEGSKLTRRALAKILGVEPTELEG